MKKRVLVLNGSFCERPIIEKAKSMGFYVITTGNAPELMGHRYADEYIPCDYSDGEAVLKLVRENDIDGVISCANDFGVLTSSYVAEKIGWTGPDTYENSLLMHHKDRFKQYCLEHNIPAPVSEVFTDYETAVKYLKRQEMARSADDLYPVIVKANDLTGGKGINRADNRKQAESALREAFSMSRDKHIVIEPFIEGSQHTFETFVVDKKVVASTSCNCYSPINPYLIQSETFPADDIDAHREELTSLVEGMCEELDLRDGVFAFQYMMKNGQIYIIEMMRRPFGNDFLSLCAMTTGFDMVEGHIRSQLGMDCRCLVDTMHEPDRKYIGHHGVMAPAEGEVFGFEIPEDIASHIFTRVDMLTEDMIAAGQTLTIHDHTKERVTYIFYQYDDRDEMNAAVATFNDRIKVRMKNQLL